MISTGSGRLWNRPSSVVRNADLYRYLLDVDRGSFFGEQGGLDQRVELRERLDAQFLGVHL
jgi:hypothetical protein